MKTIALITGAGTGIGRALSLALVKRGIAVLAVGRRETVLKDLQKEDPQKIFIVAADVSTEEGRKKIVNALPENYALKYVIHNAGVLTPVGPLSSLTLEEWRQTMAINVEAPLFLTQALLPKMKNGRVLHISSGAAHFPIIHWTAYCTSKAALHMIYRCLNLELEKANVVIGSVCPGVVDTPMQAVIRNFSEEQFPDVENFKEYQRSKKLVSPEQCAEFLTKLLLDTSAEKFAEKDWDYMSLQR